MYRCSILLLLLLLFFLRYLNVSIKRFKCIDDRIKLDRRSNPYGEGFLASERKQIDFFFFLTLFFFFFLSKSLPDFSIIAKRLFHLSNSSLSRMNLTFAITSHRRFERIWRDGREQIDPLVSYKIQIVAYDSCRDHCN